MFWKDLSETTVYKVWRTSHLSGSQQLHLWFISSGANCCAWHSRAWKWGDSCLFNPARQRVGKDPPCSQSPALLWPAVLALREVKPLTQGGTAGVKQSRAGPMCRVEGETSDTVRGLTGQQSRGQSTWTGRSMQLRGHAGRWHTQCRES